MMPDIPANEATKLPSHGCISDEAGALKRRLVLLWQIELDFVKGIKKTGHRASKGEPEGPMLPGQQANGKF